MYSHIITIPNSNLEKVKLALKYNVPFVPKSGGHSAWSTIGQEGIIIDLSNFSKATIDKSAQTVTIQSGIVNQQLIAALYENDLCLRKFPYPTTTYQTYTTQLSEAATQSVQSPKPSAAVSVASPKSTATHPTTSSQPASSPRQASSSPSTALPQTSCGPSKEQVNTSVSLQNSPFKPIRSPPSDPQTAPSGPAHLYSTSRKPVKWPR